MGAKTGDGAMHRPESAEAEPESAEPRSRRPGRAGLFITGGVLAGCAALVGYGGALADGDKDDKTSERRVPTAAVTYEVTGTGTADITYQARNESGKAVVVKAADLPWRKTVGVPLGRNAVVTITLGEKGGEARCALAVRGEHVQGATASGEFGRATCTGTLPARPDAPED